MLIYVIQNLIYSFFTIKTRSSNHGYETVSKYLFRVGTYVASFVPSMSPKCFFLKNVTG